MFLALERFSGRGPVATPELPDGPSDLQQPSHSR
jgi:hypothetical protein